MKPTASGKTSSLWAKPDVTRELYVVKLLMRVEAVALLDHLVLVHQVAADLPDQEVVVVDQ